MKNTLALISLVCAASISSTVAFSPAQTTRANSSLQAEGRRDFLDTAGFWVAGVASTSFPLVASADDETAAVSDDLAMPSEEEQKKADEAAMAERLRRKAELQKQNSRPATFQDSLAKEMQRKKDLKSMTKEERRNELCETLGRGC